jgi:hypothetical protein
MQAVTGVFSSQAKADYAIESLLSNGVVADKITLLTPGTRRRATDPIPVDAGEQPGIGKAIGAAIGAAGGITGGSILAAAMIPGVGPVTAVGLLGAAILGAAGAGAGAIAGGSLENSLTEGLPEDEIFVYEDALRKGRSVVIVLAEDADSAEPLRALLKSEGAETVDAARHQWWIGLQSAEREHYSISGRDFRNDEEFYRRGFEDALHARTRCKEFDQVSAEMESNLEELQKQYPGIDLAEAYTRGYERGREYYQRLCDEKRAA